MTDSKNWIVSQPDASYLKFEKVGGDSFGGDQTMILLCDGVPDRELYDLIVEQLGVDAAIDARKQEVIK